MSRQHVKPCKDCPWRRKAARGWLGSNTAKQWLALAHFDALVDCHLHAAFQCAGIAIYRANTCKLPQKPSIELAPDAAVFSNPAEFFQHHTRKPLTTPLSPWDLPPNL